MWEENLTRFINYSLDNFPFPLAAMSLMIMVVPAFVYYILKDFVEVIRR